MSKFILPVLLLTLSLPVSAKNNVSILGFEADSGLEKKAKMATSLFRKYAKRNHKYNLLPAIEIEEVKIEYCDEDNDTPKQCLVKIAKQIKAHVLITGKVSKKDNKIKIAVSFLANGNMKYTFKVFPLNASKSVYKKKIKAIWNGYFSTMKSKLVLNISVAGAKVFIDNNFLFNSVPGDNEIPQIAPGKHEIKVISGSTEWKKSVTIKKGAVANIEVKFAKKTIILKSDNSTKNKSDNNGTNIDDKNGKTIKNKKPLINFSNGSTFWKAVFIGTAAASAILIAGGIYEGLQVFKYEDDKDAILKQDPQNPLYQGNDVCSGATGDLAGVCNNGKSAASMANMFLISGVAVGVLSTFFLYKGYIATKSDVKGDVEPENGSGNLTVVPIITPFGGGISLGTKF